MAHADGERRAQAMDATAAQCLLRRAAAISHQDTMADRRRRRMIKEASWTTATYDVIASATAPPQRTSIYECINDEAGRAQLRQTDGWWLKDAKIIIGRWAGGKPRWRGRRPIVD